MHTTYRFLETKGLPRREKMPTQDEIVKEQMTRALKIAKASWDSAEMPPVYRSASDDSGKIALALIAGDIYKYLQNKTEL